jgi:hypothetical protein
MAGRPASFIGETRKSRAAARCTLCFEYRRGDVVTFFIGYFLWISGKCSYGLQRLYIVLSSWKVKGRHEFAFIVRNRLQFRFLHDAGELEYQKISSANFVSTESWSIQSITELSG